MTDDRDNPADESAGNWAASALSGVFERCRREQLAAEEHARTCTDRPCERCSRYMCKRCSAPCDGAKMCTPCNEAEYLDHLLRATRESVPPHFRWAFGVALDDLRRRVQCSPEVIRRGLENPPNASLLFLGDTGAGKTSLAVAMLGAWVRREPGKRSGARFVEAAVLSRARARHKLGEEAPLVVTALSAPLLVLDDLGSEREDRDGCITDVVYGRSNADRPTWVTCGLAGQDVTVEAFAEVLAKRYDGGFVRRIIENGKRVQLGSKP